MCTVHADEACEYLLEGSFISAMMKGYLRSTFSVKDVIVEVLEWVYLMEASLGCTYLV
jgi:hypothetical protein